MARGSSQTIGRKQEEDTRELGASGPRAVTSERPLLHLIVPSEPVGGLLHR